MAIKYCFIYAVFYVPQKREGLAVTDIGRAYEMVSQIKGYLVEFPQRFLENQEMKNVVFPLTVRFFT